MFDFITTFNVQTDIEIKHQYSSKNNQKPKPTEPPSPVSSLFTSKYI